MKSKGFTLVELVIVIVIIGVLSIVAVPVYKSYIAKAKIAQNNADIKKSATEEIPLEETLDDSMEYKSLKNKTPNL